MAEKTAGFETGVHGNALAAADAGDATAWTAVETPAFATYDSTRVKDGSYSAQVVIPATRKVFYWSQSAVTDQYGRVYVYFTAVPTSTAVKFCGAESSGGVRAAYLAHTTSGKLSAISAGGTVITTTASIELDRWVRIEWHFIHSDTTGQMEIKLFNDPNSETPTEVQTSASNIDTNASSNFFLFGKLDTDGSDGYTYWLDRIVAEATSYPGPVPFRYVPSQYLDYEFSHPA